MKKTVDDYLQEGIYGAKETKPDERRYFLSTLRERVVIALKQHQVREKGIYKEVEESMKKHPRTHLYLNGNMNYTFLSDYVKKATQLSIPYTMVTNKEYNSELGLVLAYDYAINKESIYIEHKEMEPTPPKEHTPFLKKLFGKK
ncbi:hypothetical protein Q75_01030 [Bacillus coahuilensis p1.1.43]|uniref:DUF1694 domain-containing protein n=1 Tax=Bacillus coahuilensis p1.1.43 TaxID=1150625 RepID=A0A147KCD7_9BACI|nr:YueI family protein [Bacillus coahuilensis]KUP09245.1 hypothetical protein Q75_01030 [Bacillus coahuilensis p1.1.43]